MNREAFFFFSQKKGGMNEVPFFLLAVGEKFLRFPSEMEPQWIEIDLEKICKIDAVRVKWWGSLAPMTCWVRFFRLPGIGMTTH